jgi:hypothetical protein
MTHQVLRSILALTAISLPIWPLASAPASEPSSSSAGVMPWHLPEQNNPDIRIVQDQLYHLAQTQTRYLLTTVHPWSEDPALKLLTQSKSLEHWIRPNAAALQGFSFLYRFGPYDENVVGVSRARLLQETIIPMMRYLTTTHVTGTRPTSDGKKWGDHWQSAYWAQCLGRAAWWAWDDVPEDLRQAVRQVIAHEADRFVNATPPHQLKNDTKAEENAWNSMIFNMAVVLMPSDPRRAAWENAFQRWVLSSFLRPADATAATIVDGRPVSEQFTGANIYDDFTLENHRRVHPDYMGAITLSMSCALDYDMTGRKPPQALFYNTREIFENLKWFFLPDGGCVYPNGEDWELFVSTADWPDQLIQMAVYEQDPDAWSLLKNNLATIAKLQARNPEGPLHVTEEFFYPGTQQSIMEEVAREWLMLQGARTIVDQPRLRLGIKRLDSGKIIVHRTPRAIHTLSWGAVVMAQCVPLRQDRVVSPDERSGIGHVRLEGDKKVLPVELRSANVSDSPDGFVADLIVDHADAVRAELHFRSSPDGTLLIREKLSALRDLATSEIATGLIGVLNDPKWVYETHHRRIQFAGQATDVPALSGKMVEGEGARRIDVDGALSIEAAAPLHARYLGAKQIERGRATDTLYLNYLDGRHDWKAGQVISTYEATVAPSNTSAQKED